MTTNTQSVLECIEEESSITSSSSSDVTDCANGLCKRDVGELSLSTATADCVNLQNSSINIDSSNDVVIGPVTHFHGPVSIYQSQNEVSVGAIEDGGKNGGKLVKSESVSSEKSFCGDEEGACTKLRFLFVLSSFIVIATVVTVAAYFTGSPAAPEGAAPADPETGDHRVIYREEWGGRPPLYTRELTLPVTYVIISHTAGTFCTSTIECAADVQAIQTLHVTVNNSPDIGYNFLVGGDGNIYVGRDWNTRNFHMDDSIGVCFMGNYVYDTLTDTMVEAAQLLLEIGLKKGYLKGEYRLIAHNQTFVTLSPGENVYKVIKEWEHFYPGYVEG